MTKKRLKLALMLTLVGLSLVSLTACSGGKDVIQREQVKVSRGDIMTSISGDGNLSLPNHRQLTFGTTGKIIDIKVQEGDRVTTGQVLSRLDTTPLEQTVKTAELAVNAATLAVKNAEVDLKISQDTATVNIRNAKIGLEQAGDSLRKISYPYSFSTFVLDIPQALSDMSDTGRLLTEAQGILVEGLSSAQYFDIKQRLKDARGSLTKAQERLSYGQGANVFEEQLLPVKDFWTLRAAQLSVDQAQSALDQATGSATTSQDKSAIALEKAKNDLADAQNERDKAKAELDKATMLSPFTGTIAKVQAKTGDVLSAVNYATETIMEIIDPSHMELKADVDEIDIPQVKPGQKVVITMDALPDVKLEGQVGFISPLSKEEAGVVLYEVKIAFNVPQGLAVKSGMSASASIILEKRGNVLLVPSRAITQDSSGKPVVKMMVGNVIQVRPVVTGISDASQTEIISGLSEGEAVVVERVISPQSSGGLFGG